MKNNFLTAALVVSWQNTENVSIGSQVPFVAEIFPLINAHKIRTVELGVIKWGTEMVLSGLKTCLFCPVERT